MIFRRRAFLFLMLLLVLAGLSACTRERTPWPTFTPGPFSSMAIGTPTAVYTPSGTLLPRYTPHVIKPVFVTDTPVPPTATTPPVMPSPVVQTPASAPAPGGPTPIATLPPGYQRYTVQPGETLYDIAVKFNVSLEALARANLITDPTTIKPDQELLIPPR